MLPDILSMYEDELAEFVLSIGEEKYRAKQLFKWLHKGASLDEMTDFLNPGGRFAIITFHSLEDRIVKTSFKKSEDPCECPKNFPVCVCGKVSKGKQLTKKPILPSEKELEENSRSKSAKLRVFERK